MTTAADIEAKRIAKQELSAKLFKDVEPKLVMLKNGFICAWCGTLVGVMLSGVIEKPLGMQIMLFASLAYYFLHKYFQKDLLSPMNTELEYRYPQKELYPDSAIENEEHNNEEIITKAEVKALRVEVTDQWMAQSIVDYFEGGLSREELLELWHEAYVDGVIDTKTLRYYGEKLAQLEKEAAEYLKTTIG